MYYYYHLISLFTKKKDAYEKERQLILNMNLELVFVYFSIDQFLVFYVT